MGTTLTGKLIADTYDALLKVTDNNVITGIKKRMTDGFGNDTPLLISTTDVQVDGNFLTESVQFNVATAQTADTVGKLAWNDADGTLDLRLKGGNVTLQIGQEQVVRVVNKTGANLLESQYKVVKVDGAQGQRLKVALAQANNDANSAETLGLVTENINNNQEGFITVSGLVRGVNTTGSLQGETWADGDMLYLSGTTAGQLTKVKPIAPIHTVIVGYVVHAHPTQGTIFVKVDNGYELDELHNVAISSPTNGQALVYEASTGLWKNQTLATGVTSFNTRTGAITLTSGDVTSALGFTPVTNARTLTINGTTYDLSANRSWNIDASKWSNNLTGIYNNSGTVSIGTGDTGEQLLVATPNPAYGVIAKLKNSFSGSPFTGTKLAFETNGVSTWHMGLYGGIDYFSIDRYNGGSYTEAFGIAGDGDVLIPGDVGIGAITNPSQKLHVDGNILATSFIKSGGTSAQLLAANGSVVTAGTNITISGGTISANNASQWITSGSNIYYNTGNVGIGTSSPQRALHVYSGSTTDTAQVIIGSGSNTARTYIGTFANNTYISSGGTFSSGWSTDGTNGIGNIVLESFNGGSAIAFGTASSNTSPSERMRITSGGNVGIGTSSPQVRFHSYGGALTVNDEGTYSARFSNNSNKGIVIGYDTTNNKGHIGSINPAVAWTDLILNANGGNVGIGTSSPTAKLTIDTLAGFGLDIFRSDVAANYGAIRFRNTTNSSNFGTIGFDSGGLRLDGDAGTMYFSTSGTERMRITSGGSLLLGDTVAPNTSAWFGTAVFGKSGTDKVITGYLTAATNGAIIGGHNSALNAWADLNIAGTNLIFKYNGQTEGMRITSGGNVGIGTSSPGAPLAFADVEGLKIQFNANAANYYGISKLAGGGNLQDGNFQFVSGNTFAGGFTFSSGGSERMRITSGGNVGIGTSSPSNRLQISTSVSYNSINDGLKIDGSVGGGNPATPAYYGALVLSGNGFNWAAIRTIQTNPSASWDSRLAFSTMPGAGDYNLYERLSITNTGNVGIGTSSPNAYSGFVGLTLDSASNGGVLSIRKNGTTYLNIYSGTNLANIYTEGGSTALTFGTGGSERMRIDSGGYVQIGGTTTYNTSRVNIEVGTDQSGITTNVNSSDNRYHLYFRNTLSTVGSISTSGFATSFNTSSDYRLKEDFKPFNGLSVLNDIKVYDFKWKGSDKRNYGVVAHEIAEVVPYAVNGEKDGEMYQSVDYSKLVPVLIQAIQELTEKVNKLENK